MASDDSSETERQRGKIFTNAQRDYLKTGSASSKNYESTLESRIRQRVIGALEDIRLLENLDKDDRKYIYNSNKQAKREGVNYHNTEYGTLRHTDSELFLKEGPVGLTFAFDSMLHLFWKTIRENSPTSCEYECSRLEFQLKRVEEHVLAELDEDGHRYEVEAKVSIKNSEKVDIEDAKERFKQDGIQGVSKPELKALEDAGHLGFEENPK